MLKKLYDRLMALSHKGYAQAILFGVAFLESSCFPIPPDAFLIPFALANRARAFRFAGIATVGSVMGGILGYGIGFYFADTIGRWILVHLAHSDDALSNYQAWFSRWGIWIIFFKGFVLFFLPFKIVTIAAGVAHFNLFKFVGSCIVVRGFRFYLDSYLCLKYGEAAMPVIERNLTRIGIAVLGLAVGGIVVLRYTHHT